jgi:hypothetical protein
MDEPRETQPPRSSILLFVLVGAAAFLTLILSVFLFYLLKARKNVPDQVPQVTQSAAPARELISQTESPTPGDGITIRLGEDEVGRGLKHIDDQKDGSTTNESINGLAARVLRLTGTRTALNFYFRIDSAFKQEDVRRVRMDVEYLDPEPGTMGIHYDADAPDRKNPAYKEASRPITLAGTGRWNKATFYTENDAAFRKRQNGGADFRIWAKAPILYVRRVTVTRETP